MKKKESTAVALATETRLTNYRFEEAEETSRPHPLTLVMVPAKRTPAYAGLRRNLLVGLAVVLLFGGGVAALAAQTVIAGAVVAMGALVVESGSKAVQHPNGGIVKELLVSEDDHVVEGQALIRLDTTLPEAQLKSAETSLVQQRARLDRLISERDGLAEIRFSPENVSLIADPRFTEAFESERQQFRLRREGRDGQRAQIAERIEQTKEEIKGNVAQLEAKKQEVEIAKKEIEGLRQLFEKKLVSQQRLNAMERDTSEAMGVVGALQSRIASGRGKVSELELMVMQVDQNLRSEITDQIAAAQSNISTLTEKRVVAQTALSQSVITAPQTGVVHELKVHTVGGVVRPAETLMEIVPGNDRLVGEVRIKPSDIDQLFAGQEATITFSAFDRGTTPQINGWLAAVSPDLQIDQQTGARFFKGRISVSDKEIERLGEVKLVPGMPLEVFIKTGNRTMVSYFLKPVTDQFNRAFR